MKKLSTYFVSCLIMIQLNVFAQAPVANFNFTDVCLGNSTTFTDLTANAPSSWSWNFGDGSGTSTQQNPIYNYANAGNYGVTLIAQNASGYDTILAIVTVFANPSVNAGVDQAICMGTSAGLSASGAVTYIWAPATSLSSNTVANPTASPTTTTNYTVTGTDANGCTANDMVTVTVNPLPNINAGVDQTICSGDGFTPSASGGISYIWDNGATNGTPIYPSVNTSYTVTGTDINGCMANDSVSITVNPLPIINYTSHTLCETSGGFATVNLTTMDNYISGGLNMVNWYLDGSYTTPITDPSAFYTDSTIVYTQIVDINGCENTNIVEINIPINDIVVTPTPADASCNGLCDGSVVLNPSGGMAPFNYNWTPGGMTSNPLTGLCSGTYTYTIIDANGCIQFDDVIINEPLPNSIINGIVYYQGTPITAGVAELIRKDGSLPTDMTLVRTETINPTSGEFIFSELPVANYIIKVLGDTTLYNCAATYPNLTAQWQMAQEFIITSNCSDSVYVDIDLIELPSNSGTGTINGRLVEGDGGVFNKAPGEPIPDIDITIDQSPGGGIMAATTTDTLGYFTVTNLPMGTYTVYADMHGYGVTLQTIDINTTTPSYDVILCSDTAIDMIEMCEMTVTSVEKVNSKNQLNIYPNPATDVVNIIYNGNQPLNLELTDITGKKVMSQTLKSNTKSIDVSNLVNGIYFMRIYNNQDDYIHKLIIGQ